MISDANDERACGTPSTFVYDYSKSTGENYAADEGTPFVGKYGHLRSELDYTHHSHYIPERQVFHDQLIDIFRQTIVRDEEKKTTCEVPEDNWLVFTAGCMGAGKVNKGVKQLFIINANATWT
jgi:hypothetical protein